MKKGIVLIWLVVIFALPGYTRQLPVASHYWYDFVRINPGSAGSNDMICTSVLYKKDFVGFPGAPENILFNVSAPFNLFGMKHGIGLSIESDVLGYYNDIDFGLSYANRISFRNGTLGIGIRAAFTNKKLKPDLWIGSNGDAPSSTDTQIPAIGDYSEFSFNLGFGLFYRSEDMFFGVSATNLYAQEVEYVSTSSTTTATEQFIPQYFLTAGYNMQLSNPAYEIQPSVLVHTDTRVVEFDINMLLTYNKKIWGGVSYRPAASVAGMVGFSVFDGLNVSASYGFPTSDLNQYTMKSWEVALNYCFKLGVEKSPKQYRSIRYL